MILLITLLTFITNSVYLTHINQVQSISLIASQYVNMFALFSSTCYSCSLHAFGTWLMSRLLTFKSVVCSLWRGPSSVWQLYIGCLNSILPTAVCYFHSPPNKNQILPCCNFSFELVLKRSQLKHCACCVINVFTLCCCIFCLEKIITWAQRISSVRGKAIFLNMYSLFPVLSPE